MGIFDKFKIRKIDETSVRELEKFHGRTVSYAVERINGEEVNLGRQGGISVVGDEIVVMLNGHEAFRCKTKGCVVSTLMSGNGCDIKGDDAASGKRRHIVCFYAKRPH